MKPRYDDLIVAVDIGSSKIVTVISEINDTGSTTIIGIGKSKNNDGVKNGVVVNINAVVEALNESISEAEMQAGREIKSVYVGVSGKDVESINSKGVVAISGHDKEIRKNDVDRVIEAAKAVAIPLDREILHIVPQWFSVDGQDNIKLPIGMVGTRLESQIHIITTSISSIQNVNKCFERIGLPINGIILQNLASARSVLTNDEKELGVVLIDIGSETTKVSVYQRQSPIYNTIFHKIGGYLVTNDIAVGLKISTTVADALKIEHGVADFEMVDDLEKLQIPVVGGRSNRVIPTKTLVHIIKPRLAEMFKIIKEDIEKKGYLNNLSGGVVLTGGTSHIPGIDLLCQEVFDLPSRVGYVKRLSGLGDQIASPEFAVVNGLVLMGFDRYLPLQSSSYETRKKKNNESGNTVFDGIKSFFSNFF